MDIAMGFIPCSPTDLLDEFGVTAYTPYSVSLSSKTRIVVSLQTTLTPVDYKCCVTAKQFPFFKSSFQVSYQQLHNTYHNARR